MSILNTIIQESSVSDDAVSRYMTIGDRIKSGMGIYKPNKRNIKSRWLGATAYRLGMTRPTNRQAAKGWDWARQDKERAYEEYLFKSPRRQHKKVQTPMMDVEENF